MLPDILTHLSTRCGVLVWESVDWVCTVSCQLLCHCQEHWADHVLPASRICKCPSLSHYCLITCHITSWKLGFYLLYFLLKTSLSSMNNHCYYEIVALITATRGRVTCWDSVAITNSLGGGILLIVFVSINRKLTPRPRRWRTLPSELWTFTRSLTNSQRSSESWSSSPRLVPALVMPVWL